MSRVVRAPVIIGLNSHKGICLSFAELSVRKPSSVAELKRKETTAVVLLGVIGAEFGQDTSESRHEDRRKSSVAEGFNINNNLARLTSKYLINFFFHSSLFTSLWKIGK